MKKLLYDILNKIDRMDVTFADVRFTDTDEETIYFEKGDLKYFGSDLDMLALGVRVLINGTWGFAGTNKLDEQSIDKAIDRAIKNAKSGSRYRWDKVRYKPMKPVTESHLYKPKEDPFLMDPAEKIGYFERIAKKLTHNDAIVYSYLYAIFYRQYKLYANTEGTMVDTLLYDVNPSMYVLASNGREAMSRTYPGHMAARRGGFEVIRDYEMEANVDTIISQAIELLKAPNIEDEKSDLIICGGHLALQLHESVGHATEADRIFGKEVSYAGKTFIKPSMLGNFRYGSDIVSIYSDSTDERGIGFHPVDDEGTPSQKVDIIKNGILVDQQTSREVAPLLDKTPSSNMKASYADDIPLIRMTNFCLAPHKGTLKDLIENTEKGYLIDFTKTWSIDDSRNNFQFTTEIGWKIENGKVKHIVKEPTYYGITPEFWQSCDWICGEEDWRYFGTFNCGKGEPGQAMHLSHGVAPARFKDVVCNLKA